MSTVTAYIRVGTDKQTLENQRSEISRFALGRRMEIGTWVEEVISGKVKGKDRKLGLLLKRMKKGDVLIVSELPRLSRTLLEIMSIVRTILEKGVLLYSVKENCCLGDNINSKVIIFASGMSVSGLSKQYSVSRETMTKYLKMYLPENRLKTDYRSFQ